MAGASGAQGEFFLRSEARLLRLCPRMSCVEGLAGRGSDLHSKLMHRVAYPMIAALFIGCTLFARNSLAGQPKLQQRLVKLPVYIGLASDVSLLSPSAFSSDHSLIKPLVNQVWLYSIVLFKLPRAVLFDSSIWTPSIKGLIYGLPAATLLKLVWLFGIGRDVV